MSFSSGTGRKVPGLEAEISISMHSMIYFFGVSDVFFALEVFWVIGGGVGIFCNFGKIGSFLVDFEVSFFLLVALTRCLKITEKVPFCKIASAASYVYISNGQKFIKNA